MSIKIDSNLKVKNISANVVSTKQLQLQPQSQGLSCITLSLAVAEPVGPSRVLKVSPGNDFQVEEMRKDDDDYTGIIGVSTTSANYEENVNVCILGVFDIEIESNTSVTSGDNLKISTVEDGCARSITCSVGTFGIALQSASPSPAAIEWTGDSNFDEEILTFPEVVDVSSICFSGDGYGHSHENQTTINVSLWNGAAWIEVYKRKLNDDENLYFNTLGKVTFPNIPSVTQIRFSSNPYQYQTFHSMSSMLIKFNCNTIKACFKKNENY